MARSLWPAGIHVALVVVDGVVDLPRTRKALSDKPDSFFIKPAAVAETVYQLSVQDPSAWSFEAEARPFGEIGEGAKSISAAASGRRRERFETA